MELKDFVSQTIIQVISGIVESQKQVEPLGAKVNPATRQVSPRAIARFGSMGLERNAYAMEFDIAIGETTGDGLKTGVGVITAIIGAGAQTEAKSSQTNESRVRFLVPVAFPDHPGTKD